MLKRSLALAAMTAVLSVPALTSTASAQSATLFAVLNGGNECNGGVAPAGPICAIGDPDGWGSATVIFPTATTACFGVTLDNLVPVTAMHIHDGKAGTNGAVVIPLVPPVAAGAANPGAFSGCVGGLPAGLAAAIIRNPGNFYVNVHNAAFPGGAVRGQLF